VYAIDTNSKINLRSKARSLYHMEPQNKLKSTTGNYEKKQQIVQCPSCTGKMGHVSHTMACGRAVESAYLTYHV